MALEALSVAGAIVTACGIINDLRKAFKGISCNKEKDKLFDEVEITKGMVSHLTQRLRNRRGGEFGELIAALNKLEENLHQTHEFLKDLTDNPPLPVRFLKWRRVKKDVVSKLSGLQMSRATLSQHITIDSLPVGDQNSQLSSGHLINPEDLDKIEDLSPGTWGPVRKAKFKGYQDVVIKYVSDVENPELIANFEKESRNLVRFWHGYVVQLIGICSQKKLKFMVLEYMHNGALDHLLHSCSNIPLEPKRRVSMALDTAKAVLQVNAVMLHTGIEARRFLVDKHFNVKISDLRFAKTFSSCQRFRIPRVGSVDSIFYMCPERYHQPAPYTEKSEVYRLGIVLWEILSRTKPFSMLASDPSFDNVKTFVEADRKEELTEDFGNPQWNLDLNTLVKNCRSLDPEQRPLVKDIVKELERILDEMEREEEAEGVN